MLLHPQQQKDMEDPFRKFIILILLTGYSIAGIAQVKSNREKEGDKYAFAYSFDKAAESYSKAKNLTAEGQRGLALCYSNLEKHKEAETAYSKLLRSKEKLLPEDYYNYAMVLKTNGKYEEANKWMDIFAELKPQDLRAKSHLENKTKLNELINETYKYKITNLYVNTEDIDFGPCFYKGKVVFTSSRTDKAHPKNYNWNGKPFLDMYMADIEGDQLKTPVVFDKNLNTKMHDGTASFSNDGNFMAFTCNNHDVTRKDKYVKLQICFSSFKDGKWNKHEPFFLNNKDYSVGHPCLTPDGKTMYFSSDMPGGYGKADIYRIKKDEKGNWGKPENMGAAINTEGDDMFPFFESNNSILFFTSNGHYGLGGLDIFTCALTERECGPVRNAGFPLNTQYDDFAIIANDSITKGYFSSNREGGCGDDDIYFVDISKMNLGKKIIGVAKDKDLNILPHTFITLKDSAGNVLDTFTTKANGSYVFLVDANKNFNLSGNKKKYLEGKNTASTYGPAFVVYSDVTLLTPEEIIEKKIEVGNDLAAIPGLNPIYFDLDKYDIRKDAEPELEKIIKIMNEHPDMVIELGSHTDCRHNKKYNQVLSNNRAKASADYIKKRITNPDRIYGKGYGESKLISNCECEGKVISTCAEDEHQKNRRTEFIIIKK
jgi:outer membrane protein OmpA-like peptidoglycan-associated protein